MKNFQFSIFKADAFGRLPDPWRRGFQKKRGFALLIAVIFMSVMLSFGLALGSLGYKQQVLASFSIESQYAFYAADAALECALYADQKQNLFDFPPSDPPSVPTINCGDSTVVSKTKTLSASQWIVTNRLLLDSTTSHPRCADVTIYKYSFPLSSNGATTYVFSQGYNVHCDTVASPGTIRFVSRGQSAHY